jgi:hypothetical protein
MANNSFNWTAPFVTVCATRFARLRTNRANPLRGAGLPVKLMLARPCGREKRITGLLNSFSFHTKNGGFEFHYFQ